ncbi:RagB/SusD family nutrient uptake outer membrane protein [Xylanibacter oryzae]|uniref:RagB/SusD family nutrient uptake outer membrane protein n=1 Tax=Xylanibacter oryzae TaxID=185293 RepID=UPI0004B79BB4|nr:RagB/SusD family nutrient uptake outer membrane protein [Xylanibacter oryzae]
MKTKYIVASLFFGALSITGCTNLNEDLFNVVSMDDYGKTESEVKTIVGGAYSTLRGYGSSTDEGNGVNCYPTCEYVFFLNECVSDEACIPTRGSDWYDGGRYQQLQYHTYDASNQCVLAGWRYAFTGVSKVNAIIYQVEKSGLSDESKKKVEAELRGLRAYYYYLLLDEFGNVPISTDFTVTELPSNSDRKTVYNFVENELTDIMSYLPTGIQYGRFTQNVAYTLLARLYLNAEVYTGTAQWKKCIDACEKVSGYSLMSDYKANFYTANEGSKEIIFAIPYDHKQGTVGNYLASMTYHYNQKYAFSADGSYQWCGNGICAKPGVWSSYEDGDTRRGKTLMVGQQYSAKDGSAVNMDNGEPLNYTEEIKDYTNALQNEGARLDKYQWNATDSWERDNDWVLMRYAEVLMMEGEAYYRLGYTQTALTFVNKIRERAGLGDLTTLDDTTLDNEWLHEFAYEGNRRTVNIRFGTFYKSWWNKGEDASDHHTGIYPIPAEELSKNPNLKQNAGY